MPDDVLPLAQVTFGTAVQFGGQSSFNCGASGEVTVELDLAKRLVMLKNSRRKESILVPLDNVVAMKPTKTAEAPEVKPPGRAVDLSAEIVAAASLPPLKPSKPEPFLELEPTQPDLPPVKAKYMPKAKK